MGDIVGRLLTMPILVLSAKICPAGVEGTLFALLMSISNFSSSVSAYWGSLICYLAGVDHDHYANLPWLIIIRSLFKLVPLFFLFLIPDGNPEMEIHHTGDDISSSSLESRLSMKERAKV